MASSTTKANLMQTAYNVAGGIVAAEVTTGGNPSDLHDLADEIFTKLVEQHEKDQKQEAARPSRRSSSQSGSNAPRSRGRAGSARRPSGSGRKTDPAEVVLNDTFPKHVGKTLAEVYDEDPTYVSEYLTNKTGRQKKSKWMANIAREFMATVEPGGNEEYDEPDPDYLPDDE